MQILDPFHQALTDVDELAAVLYEVNDSGGWAHASWGERRYWIGIAAKVIDHGWHRVRDNN